MNTIPYGPATGHHRRPGLATHLSVCLAILTTAAIPGLALLGLMLLLNSAGVCR